MGLSIKNEAVETLARDLARRHGTGVTEIIRLALVEKAERDLPEKTLWEKLAPIHAELAAMPNSGLQADRAFYDELNGEAERQ
ncbi:type II toxin-antitoxin system VapB family antitoxin [Bosea sp. 685]|uniref:type II toxin-antitoxin system VapB family antitoxin n=1 Tax=Bosea sp. 685 TaxID=3080057 RepID=UPI0028937C26|nr:type II toxin-antitoxin system VapB family antitoxin [Bosea sp. 685]WNJ88438.1 type II toxin-antitoxin system VapB family antitoxin [Bosea sp. 685]